MERSKIVERVKLLLSLGKKDESYFYCRGEARYPIKPLASSPVRQNSEMVHGVAVRTDRVDFLVSSESLPFEPERDDRIIQGEFQFTVLPVDLGGQEACFRYVTPCRQLMKIHTKIDQ